MSPMRVTFKRTVGMVSKLYVTALSIAVFFAGAATLFAFNLDAAEGTFSALAPLWTVSVSPILPVLAALVGMEVWSDERKTGRIDVLLSSPVRERDFVVGKFLGVWFFVVTSILLFLASTLAFLNFYAPKLAVTISVAGFLPGIILLILQGSLWSAVAIVSSALFRNAAGSAATTIFALVALPRALWAALSYWTHDGLERFGELPMDIHAFDFSSGLISVGVIVSYILLTFVALFVASKIISSLRFVGRNARRLRFSTSFSLILSVLFSILAIALVYRVNVNFDIPVAGSGETRFSAHTRSVLEQARGSVSIIAFLERKDSRFRHVSHFLRSLKRDADEVGGVRLDIKYVDPVLDIAEATRLVREGVEKSSFVFERDGRIVHTLSIDEGYSERIISATIERIAVPFQRSSIYWTVGHSEATFDDYNPEGLSDVARELSLNGYDNKKINLADSNSIIGKDCALLIIAGPKKDFAESEIERLRSYLNGQAENSDGGRVLVLINSLELRGLVNLLSSWGIRPGEIDLRGVSTMTGDDVIVKDFSEAHAITRTLKDQQVILYKPLGLSLSSSAIEGASGADLKRYSWLIEAGGRHLASVVECGSTRSDVAMRPSRLVVIGDVVFIMNNSLRSYANANRDFFMNCVKYLSGRDVMVSSGAEVDRLVTGMDRDTRIAFTVFSSAVFPAVVLILCVFFIVLRRRR